LKNGAIVAADAPGGKRPPRRSRPQLVRSAPDRRHFRNLATPIDAKRPKIALKLAIWRFGESGAAEARRSRCHPSDIRIWPYGRRAG
jgi:hypothetical protein